MDSDILNLMYATGCAIGIVIISLSSGWFVLDWFFTGENYFKCRYKFKQFKKNFETDKRFKEWNLIKVDYNPLKDAPVYIELQLKKNTETTTNAEGDMDKNYKFVYVPRNMPYQLESIDSWLRLAKLVKLHEEEEETYY